MFRNGKNFGAAPGSLKDKVRPPDSSKIYQQEGDTFSICADALGTKVPTSFKAGGSVLLTVARRGEIAFAEVEPPLTGRAARRTKATAKAPKNSNGVSQQERVAALAAAEANAEHKTFKGAKITKAQRAGGTLVAAGGEEYFFQMSPKTPAFVQDGTRLANATLLCHDDNIVDVNIVYAGLRPPPWKVTEIHLVSGSIAPYPARTSKPAR